MLQKIRIQNFRSLKDITVDLQQVNLLIGPNNSGKSNFLKAIEFFSLHINKHQFNKNTFEQILFREELKNLKTQNNEIPITFELISKFDDFYEHYVLQIFDNSSSEGRFVEFLGKSDNSISKKINLFDIDLLQKNYSDFQLSGNNIGLKKKTSNSYILDEIEKKQYNYQTFLLTFEKELSIKFEYSQIQQRGFKIFNVFYPEFKNTIIYKPDTVKLTYPQELGEDVFLNADTSNLVSFLDNMRDSNPEVIKNIETDLNKCISNFKDIRYKKIFEDNNFVGKKLGLSDTKNNIYWAEELSEGTLYFLAILSIIHQPNPPKLLLLEEPEKNVHPRRIAEVMDYIFQLAYEKNIQVILTTHNTLVVDEFNDIPEAVHIFEHKNNQTEIKNLQKDIIEPSDKKSEAENFPKINYTHSLGEHWSYGFLGGVPLD